jgi:hypothetical protein
MSKFKAIHEPTYGCKPSSFDMVPPFVVVGATATAESDFSTVRREKDCFRTDLTNFSLEGILHCAQRKILQQFYKSPL